MREHATEATAADELDTDVVAVTTLQERCLTRAEAARRARRQRTVPAVDRQSLAAGEREE